MPSENINNLGFEADCDVVQAIVPVAYTTSSVPIAGVLVDTTTAARKRKRILVIVNVKADATSTGVTPAVKQYSAGASVAVLTCANATDIWTSAAHGLVAGDQIIITALTGGTLKPALNTLYTVLTANLTTDTFQLSALSGGAIGGTAFDVTGSDITVGAYFKASNVAAVTSTGTFTATNLASAQFISVKRAAGATQLQVQATPAGGSGVVSASVVFLP